MKTNALTTLCVMALAAFFLSSCGSSDSSVDPACSGSVACGEVQPPPEPEPEPEPEDVECTTVEYESTFDVVQSIFNEKCVGCHGSENPSAGLDLSAGNSYANIFEVPSTQSDLQLVHPGDTERSYLFLKVAAPYDDSVVISGGRMPAGGSLTEREVDIIRFWIYAGGTDDTVMVQGTDEIVLDACLAEPDPYTIEPLDAPAESEGVQIEMPYTALGPAGESETCVAVFEDFCDRIPEEYLVPGGGYFYYDVNEIRMEAFSHHLLVQMPASQYRGEFLDPSEFSGWKCRAGERDGEECDPRDREFCGEGRCATEMENSTACIGYGPANGNNLATFTGTQQPQAYSRNADGVYSIAPCRTIVAWNLHAFNLTAEEAEITAKVNFEFAEDRRWPSRRLTTDGGGGLGGFGIGRLTREGAEAYTENTLCTDVELPQGCFLVSADSHNHYLGVRAWWTDPDGKVFYDSRIYNDPVNLRFEDPIEYPEADPATRTFRFCTTYRNGIDENGNIDVDRMSRSSTRPYSFFGGEGGCEPYRCVNEGVDRRAINCDDGIANFKGNDAACNSPGKEDGFCDGCSIRGGVTTQDEMYQGGLGFYCPN